MPAPFAAIDLGSNSFHLLVAKVRGGKIERIERRRDGVRLRSGMGEDGLLTPEAIERALDSLDHFGRILREEKPAAVRAVATNSFRAARNGEELAERGSERLGHPIEIIDGKEEARLIYRALEWRFGSRKRPLVGVDIGGGSTEVMRGSKGRFERGVSLELGCISWSERHFPEGRLGPELMDTAVREAREIILPHADAFRGEGLRFVGSSGTIRNVSRIVEAAGGKRKHITRKDLDAVQARIAAASSVDELRLEGMKSRRAPIIAGGVAILEALFQVLEIPAMDFSKVALREGVLLGLAGD